MIKLILGDCLSKMKDIPDNSVDSIVTDPPAGISFMGKEWDRDKGGRDNWVSWMQEIAKECLRVIKPGGHALVWAIPRTSHWTGMAWELAGWVPREKVYHCFGSGFPKSLDISKQLDKMAGAEREKTTPRGKIGTNKTRVEQGYRPNEVAQSWNDAGPVTPEAKQFSGWGTALKPAIEEWWMFRKPLDGTVAENVLKWGVGGLNIDGCRVGTIPRKTGTTPDNDNPTGSGNSLVGSSKNRQAEYDKITQGRFPANLILDGSPEVVGLFPETKSKWAKSEEPLKNSMFFKNKYGEARMDACNKFVGDSGSAARFFKSFPSDNRRLIYTAKASRSERGEGNTHATVKPIALMRYLCRLITPPNGVILDPFMGSGSTGVAAIQEGFQFIGIENDKESYEIAEARINNAIAIRQQDLFS